MRAQFRLWLVGSICAAAFSMSGEAALLTTFSFTGAAGNEPSFTPDSQPTGAAVTSMTRGSGISPVDGAGAFNAGAWTASAAPDPNDYYTFTITPDANNVMTLTRLELDERRSGTGIREWAIYSSLDSYGAALAAFSVPDDTNTRANQGVDLSSDFSGLSSAITFRIYAYAAEAGTGTWRIDNVELFGSITAVPEPANAALGVFGVLAASAGLGAHLRRQAGRRRGARN